MVTQRERIIDRLMAPYGISADEVLADADIARGCYAIQERQGVRLITAEPLMRKEVNGISSRRSKLLRHEDLPAQVADARMYWLPFMLEAMRKASLREQGLSATMRPAWSILVNPVTLAAATATGIPAKRLAYTEHKEGRIAFSPLHGDGFEDHPSTHCYTRDFSHHEGSDYLQGSYMRATSYIASLALQLLEDTRFPIRSVSDQGGPYTMMEIRQQLPETTCIAVIGRPLSDLLDVPGFEPGTQAGSAVIRGAKPSTTDGRTLLDVERMHIPAVEPTAGTDMRWAIAWSKR